MWSCNIETETHKCSDNIYTSTNIKGKILCHLTDSRG